jgi:peroxiredoxin
LKLDEGTAATPITLPALDGSIFDTSALDGRPYLLSFLRSAACPFCNLWVRELARRYDEFGDDFTIVAIFESSPDDLRRHSSRYDVPFMILADEENRYSREYGVEDSLWGVVKGAVLRPTSLVKGFKETPFPPPLGGRVSTMPADFLVDRSGIIRRAYYAEDQGDHLPIDEIVRFSRKA